MGGKYSTYSDEFKADAIQLAQEIGQYAAAKQLGIPCSSLGNWVQAAGISSNLPENAERTAIAREAIKAKKAEAEMLSWQVGVELVQEIRDGTETVVSAKGSVHEVPMSPSGKRQLATAAAILFDKGLLFGGEATSRTEVSVSPLERASGVLEAAETRLRAIA